MTTFKAMTWNVENDPGRREEDVAPDHAPVTASFDLPSV
jgi:hypothetical protein